MTPKCLTENKPECNGEHRKETKQMPRIITEQVQNSVKTRNNMGERGQY